MEESEYLERSVAANAQWIDKVLWTGSIVCFGLIALKMIGGAELTYQGVKIPLQLTWILVLILTACHLYTTLLFRSSARRLWKVEGEEVCKKVWVKIVTEGGMFMRGMKPRLLTPARRNAPMANEPASWLAHVCAVAIFFAVVPFELTLSWGLLLGFAFMVANWLIGSQWAISLSELAVPKEQSFLLSGRPRNTFATLEQIRQDYQGMTRDLADALVANLDGRRTAAPLRELRAISERLRLGLLSEEEYRTLLAGCIEQLTVSDAV